MKITQPQNEKSYPSLPAFILLRIFLSSKTYGIAKEYDLYYTWRMIKEIRDLLGVTQAQLGKLTGYTQGAISHLETGRRNVDKNFADELIRAASRKGVKITYNDIFKIPTH